MWTQLTLDYRAIMQKEKSCIELVQRCKSLSRLKITNKSGIEIRQQKNPIMSVVIYAKKILKCLDVEDLCISRTSLQVPVLVQVQIPPPVPVLKLKTNPLIPDISKLKQMDKLTSLKVNCDCEPSSKLAIGVLKSLMTETQVNIDVKFCTGACKRNLHSFDPYMA